MPKSKRNKIVHLTKVKKKASKNLDLVADLVKQYSYVHILDLNKTSASAIFKVRVGLKDVGRIYAGKNSTSALAFKDAKHGSEVVDMLSGKRGLLFSDEDEPTIRSRLKEFAEFSDKLLQSFKIK